MPEPLRILHLISSLDPAGGGPSEGLRQITARYQSLGEIAGHVTGFSGRVFQRWILSGLKRAQHVVCVSEQTRSELQRLSGLPAARCSVAPNALNYPYRPMGSDEARARLQRLGASAPWPFFVHVGGNQWYKNRAGVVRLFMQLVALLPFQSHHLIMAGKPWPDELRALVQGSGLAARIHEWTELANEDLRALYSTAEALLFPSLQEGFGWPIAEAQACGCVVVTSNRAPMTEVGGDAAVYIDPDDVPGAAAVIAGTLADRAALVEAGLRNAERFSGAQMVEGYLAAYRRVVAAPSDRRMPLWQAGKRRRSRMDLDDAPDISELGQRLIRVARLADEVPTADIAAPALLKLDVQGFELQALAGCEDVLERFDWV